LTIECCKLSSAIIIRLRSHSLQLSLPCYLVHVPLETEPHLLSRLTLALIQVHLHLLNLALFILQKILQIVHVRGVFPAGLVGAKFVVFVVGDILLELLQVLLLLPDFVLFDLLLKHLIMLLLTHVGKLPLSVLAQAARTVHLYI
jgi:hypothetical protein